MVIFGFLLLLVLCIYGAWWLSTRAPDQRYGWSVFWRSACIIAALRIGAIWLGLAGIRHSDWVQIPAYFLLMAGWPDIYIVRAARSDPLRWGMLASLVLAATSPVWSAALLWLATRLRSKPASSK